MLLGDSDDTGDSLKTDHCCFAEPANENDQRCYVDLQQKIDQLSSQISQLNADLSVAKRHSFPLTNYKMMILQSNFSLDFLISLH